MNEKKLYEIVENRGKEDSQRILRNPIRASLHYVDSPDDKVWLSEVQQENPWKRFEDEKPEEGQEIEHYIPEFTGQWVLRKCQYSENSLGFIDSSFWRPFAPPLVKDEKDEWEKIFNRWLYDKYSMDEVRDFEISRKINDLKSAWQAALKSKEAKHE